MLRERCNKKEARAKVTEIQIMEAAARLFARQGRHKTTIADLAKEIGLTSGAVFYHFHTKKVILRTVSVGWSVANPEGAIPPCRFGHGICRAATTR